MDSKLINKVKELENRINQLEDENKSLKDNSLKEAKNTQKQILEKLKEGEERYILTQAIGHIGSWEIKTGEDKFWVSDETFKILGIEKESSFISEKTFLQTIHPEDRHKIENALSDLFEKHKPFTVDLKIIRYKNEERDVRTIEMIGQQIKNGNNKIEKCIGIVKDITEYRKNLKELQRSKEKAEESDRLKTSFLSNMSHDLRTPMNAIIGYSELLNIGNLSPTNRREYTKIIKQKGLQLLTLIDDIIEVSKFETGMQGINKTEFDLHELLNEVISLYNDRKVQFGKENISLLLKTPDKKIESLYSDPGRLQQVLSNLISNGLKFTDKGSVEIGYHWEDDDKIVFYVKDTGIGLSREKQKYIFNRFKSIEKIPRIKYVGSGLGLTISKKIVELLGGKIWVESEENKGAAFYFSHPVQSLEGKEDTATATEVNELAKYNWKDKVILVVEDEEVNFKFLETVLHDTQAQVLHANDGLQAIDLCLSINKIDLILMDIKMPEMDGFEAAKRIKQVKPDIPIIAQTAFASREDKMNSLQSGCDDYIAKPIEIELLISKINKFFIDRDY